MLWPNQTTLIVHIHSMYSVRSAPPSSPQYLRNPAVAGIHILDAALQVIPIPNPKTVSESNVECCVPISGVQR